MLVKISIALVAALHVLFLVLEMFLWKKPFGRKVFGLSHEQANQTAVIPAMIIMAPDVALSVL